MDIIMSMCFWFTRQLRSDVYLIEQATDYCGMFDYRILDSSQKLGKEWGVRSFFRFSIDKFFQIMSNVIFENDIRLIFCRKISILSISVVVLIIVKNTMEPQETH